MKKNLLFALFLIISPVASTFAQEYFGQSNGYSIAYGSSESNYFNVSRELHDARLYIPYYDINENRFTGINGEYSFYIPYIGEKNNKSYTPPRISTSGTDTLFVISSYIENGRSKLRIFKYYDIRNDSYFNQQSNRIYQSNNEFGYNGSALSGDGKYIISSGVRYSIDDGLNIIFSDSLVPGINDNFYELDESGVIEFRDNFAIHQMNQDGSRYSVIKTTPKNLNANDDSLITRIHYFAFDEVKDIWHEGRISFEHFKNDLFEPSFDHDFGTLSILKSDGLHEFNLASALDNVISA